MGSGWQGASAARLGIGPPTCYNQGALDVLRRWQGTPRQTLRAWVEGLGIPFRAVRNE